MSFNAADYPRNEEPVPEIPQVVFVDEPDPVIGLPPGLVRQSGELSFSLAPIYGALVRLAEAAAQAGVAQEAINLWDYGNGLALPTTNPYHCWYEFQTTQAGVIAQQETLYNQLIYQHILEQSESTYQQMNAVLWGMPDNGQLSPAVQLARDEADKKAEGMLLSLLDEEQLRQWKAVRFFDVVAPSGTTYRLKDGWSGNIEVLDWTGQPVKGLCIHPSGPRMPNCDNLVAQKFLLECDEAGFLKTANVTWSHASGLRTDIERFGVGWIDDPLDLWAGERDERIRLMFSSATLLAEPRRQFTGGDRIQVPFSYGVDHARPGW